MAISSAATQLCWKAFSAADQTQRLVLLAVLQGVSSTSGSPGPQDSPSTITRAGAKTLILISAGLIAIWAATIKDFQDRESKVTRATPLPDTFRWMLWQLSLDGLQRVLTLFLVSDLVGYVTAGRFWVMVALVSLVIVLNCGRLVIIAWDTKRPPPWIKVRRWYDLFLLVASFAEKTAKVVIVMVVVHERQYMVKADEVVAGVCLCSTTALYFVVGISTIVSAKRDNDPWARRPTPGTMLQAYIDFLDTFIKSLRRLNSWALSAEQGAAVTAALDGFPEGGGVSASFRARCEAATNIGPPTLIRFEYAAGGVLPAHALQNASSIDGFLRSQERCVDDLVKVLQFSDLLNNQLICDEAASIGEYLRKMRRCCFHLSPEQLVILQRGKPLVFSLPAEDGGPGQLREGEGAGGQGGQGGLGGGGGGGAVGGQ